MLGNAGLPNCFQRPLRRYFSRSKVLAFEKSPPRRDATESTAPRGPTAR